MKSDSAPASNSLEAVAVFRPSGPSGFHPVPMLALLAAPYLALAVVGPTESNVPETLACLGIAFAVYWFGCVENRFRLSMVQVMFLGILMRICILPMPPSDDMHRFIWEGKLLAHGYNPFTLAPNNETVAHLRDANWALVNHPNLPTLYPPVAQGLFWLFAQVGQSGLVFKIGFFLFDVFGVFAMRSILRKRFTVPSGAAYGPIAETEGARILAIYFLNPLLIFEIAGRGHFDSLPIFFNLVFLGALLARKRWAPALLGLGAMTKITSLALAPLLLFSLGWKRAVAWGIGIGSVVGGSLWAVGAFTVLGKFATKFRFNAAVPSLLDWALPFLSGEARRNLSLVLFALACLACLRLFRRAAPERQALWFMGLMLLFSPTLHPWYLLWVLPFAALALSRPWLLLTGTVLITYEVYGRAHVTGHWHENPWLRLPEFLPPLFLYLYLRGKNLRPRRTGPGTEGQAAVGSDTGGAGADKPGTGGQGGKRATA
jgi:hypothetical protein